MPVSHARAILIPAILPAGARRCVEICTRVPVPLHRGLVNADRVEGLTAKGLFAKAILAVPPDIVEGRLLVAQRYDAHDDVAVGVELPARRDEGGAACFRPAIDVANRSVSETEVTVLDLNTRRRVKHHMPRGFGEVKVTCHGTLKRRAVQNRQV